MDIFTFICCCLTQLEVRDGYITHQRCAIPKIWFNTNTNTNTRLNHQYQYQYQYFEALHFQYQYQYQYFDKKFFNTNTNTNTLIKSISIPIPIPILTTERKIQYLDTKCLSNSKETKILGCTLTGGKKIWAIF